MSAPAFKASDGLLAQQTLGAVASAIGDDINLCSNPDQLHEMARRIWSVWATGQISDDESTYLQSLIERRRPLRPTALSVKPAVGRFAGRLSSRFTPRQRQRSPDRKASRDRRRSVDRARLVPAG